MNNFDRHFLKPWLTSITSAFYELLMLSRIKNSNHSKDITIPFIADYIHCILAAITFYFHHKTFLFMKGYLNIFWYSHGIDERKKAGLCGPLKFWRQSLVKWKKTIMHFCEKTEQWRRTSWWFFTTIHRKYGFELVID